MIRETAEARFYRLTRKTDGCWIWQSIVNGKGYGRIWNGKTLVAAHRFAYELFVGPIPEGLTIDHLCGNKLCVNPAHLAPATNYDNMMRGDCFSAVNRRKTHCIHGHEFTPENTYIRNPLTDHPGRMCKACHRNRDRVRHSKKRLLPRSG